MKTRVLQAFAETFGGDPLWVVRAPGRVNLIGDHTDYNEGFVLPMAIDRAVWVALRPRADKKVVLKSLDFGENLDIDLNRLQKGGATWTEYVNAVAWTLQDAGLPLSGWEGVVAGEVPIGSGLSSSAAFELAIARAFGAAAGWPWQPERMARLMQRAENEWIGVASGIMDPLISAVAQAGKAALIDCRSLETTQVSIPRGVAVVVMNTMKRRGLVDSAYNERRRQCEAAAGHFGLHSLRDLSMEALLAAEGQMEPEMFKRARHVLSENQRVLQMAAAFERNDPAAAGALMRASHESLRADFAVSCAELDAMVAAASGQPACFGARMTGAGFGGCAVALVRAEAVEEFVAQTAREYQRVTKVAPEMLVTSPAAGASLESAG